uniref:Uncharacterized protein n=1 Tax=Lactuca sativa TaxID=4236 RepID=A0A9R1UGL8_LACSA|nr:hypothetical protein LSAT_V11C900474240 [Lactuca sativa]
MGDHHDELHEEGGRFYICTKARPENGISKPSVVQKDEDYHRGVHVWIFAESTQELLLQKRARLWDISSASHVSAGSTPLITARCYRNSFLKCAIIGTLLYVTPHF